MFDKKDNSVYLNDRIIELKGVNRHQQYPWLGDAIPGWITEMDCLSVKGNKEYNFVRNVNYPGNRSFIRPGR